ncbi:MAG TPA: NAD(P)/FAD-dependent oxidoreductase [Steroidobacteraceae bacterium]|nr:NAD(P)/FAD-dependent oxidoreductase [Steroidobacteraceae bacterium]
MSEVTIVGAGPTGSVLAILLRRRGIKVTIYESRADPRADGGERGRSINLALADRGIAALKRIGVYQSIAAALVPMPGRLIHDVQGNTSLQPYGAHSHELIHSISRDKLNQALLDIAVREHGVEVHFEHRLESADFTTATAQIRDLRDGREQSVRMRPMIACDGGGSRMRREMQAAGLIEASEVPLDHGYKELSIPAAASGDYAMRREALHIWPRGGYMLIALPNEDGSFTATLFLPNSGPTSFATLTGRQAIDAFLSRNFPDAVALMPNATEEFQRNPTGFLGTVYAQPWSTRGAAALLGDAAHAIVPFHGQGMNCCFEDCLEFDACVGRHAIWEARFNDFYAKRKSNTDAIAAISLENYLEMRAHVADERFRLRHALSLELERRFPARFIPRYSMVMFHHEIPYSMAQQRGLIQSRLLEDLTAHAATIADVDFERATRSIEAHLPPIEKSLSSVTNE